MAHTMQQQIGQFIFELNGRKSIHRAFQDHIINKIRAGMRMQPLVELLTNVNTVLHKEGLNDALLQDIFTRIRQAVKEEYGFSSPAYKQSLKLLIFDREKWRANKKAYEERVYNRNEDPEVYEWETVKRMLNTTNTNSPEDLTIFLQLCSGARITEILHASGFKESKKAGYIEQSGILKSRDGRVVIKPVLYVPAGVFMDKFTRLREDIKKNQHRSMTIITRVNRKLKNFGNISSHTLRKLYAVISHAVYGGRTKLSLWTAKVLGHEQGSLSSSHIYTTFHVELSLDDIEYIKSKPFVKQIKIQKPEITIVDGQAVVPRNTKERDGKSLERITATIRALEHNGVKITNKLLKSYGYGSSTISEYKQKK